MARKKKVGRPKKAKNEVKTGFPLRLRPALIKRIREVAKGMNKKPGPMVEQELEIIYFDVDAESLPNP